MTNKPTDKSLSLLKSLERNLNKKLIDEFVDLLEQCRNKINIQEIEEEIVKCCDFFPKKISESSKEARRG